MKKVLLFAAALAGSLGCSAQVYWDLAGNSGITPGTDFLGTTDDEPLDIRTEDIHRFRLLPDATYTIGSFTTQVKDGSLLLSPDVDQFYTNSAPGPYSLLHLAAGTNNAQQGSFREWMDLGVTLTGNDDHAYWGLKAGAVDNTDVVFHWSDNPGETLTDRIRWIFTSGYDDQDETGASSWEGLEAMRMYPVDNDNVNIGIGDWFAANATDPGITEPEERLDIVDGKVRIRQLPSDATSTSTEMVTVNMSNGVLEHRPITTLPDNCEWVLGGGANGNNVLTAFGTATDCPNEENLVGIGEVDPVAKLHTFYSPADGGVVTCGQFEIKGDQLNKTAGYFEANGNGEEHCAVKTRSYNAIGEGSSNTGVLGWAIENTANYTKRNVGTAGIAQSQGGADVKHNLGVDADAEVDGSSSASFNVGVRAIMEQYGGTIGSEFVGGDFNVWSACEVGSPLNIGVRGVAVGGTDNYGVYGSAGAGGCETDDVYAGYFAGDLYAASGPWGSSDENLKTDMERLEPGTAADQLAQVEVYSYRYNTVAHPQMHLPSGEHVGVKAQQLEEVFPQLVKHMTQPPEYDREGNLLHEAVEFKAVNMSGLVPYLLLTLQHQQERLAEMDARVAAMSEQLAGCCASGLRSSDENNVGVSALDKALDPTKDRLLCIAPNPFNEPPTVFYTLEKAGRAQLLASGSDGRGIQVLHEASLEKGDYQFTWDTAGLAAGVYYVSLLVDGKTVVQKAVKVSR